MKDKKLNKTTKQLFALAFTLILLIGGSYAWLTLQVNGEKTNVLRAGTLSLVLDDTTSEGIKLEKAVPISDEKGKTGTEYTFTLQNKGTKTASYTIYLDDVALETNETRMDDSKVKYQLTKNSNETVALLNTLSDKILDSGEIAGSTTNTYSLRVWIDSVAGNEVMGTILSKELRVEAIQAGAKFSSDELRFFAKLGDYVRMTPTSTNYTITTAMTGYDSNQTINPSELNLWRVISLNVDGTMDLVSEYTSSTDVYFKGKTGYQNLVSSLNQIASQYTNSKYTTASRHMGYNGQTGTITDTSALDSTTAPWGSSTSETTSASDEAKGAGDQGYQKDYDLLKKALGTTVANKAGTTTAKSYWLASRYFYYSSTKWDFIDRAVNTNGGLDGSNLYYYNSSSFATDSDSAAIRPIITLKSGLTPSGSGTGEDPYVLN